MIDTDFEQHINTVVDEGCKLYIPHVSRYTKAYVSGMLKQYISSEFIFDNIEENGKNRREIKQVGVQLFNAYSSSKSKELGDQCLFFVGFFYDRLLKNGQVEYFCTVGTTAYTRVQAAFQQEEERGIYAELAENFWDLGRVVGLVKVESIDEKQLLQLIDQYYRNKDQRHGDVLRIKGININDLIFA